MYVEQDRIWHTLTIYVLCLRCIETDISIIIFVIHIEYWHGTGFVFDTPSLLKRRRSLFLNNFVAAQPGNVHHYIHNRPPSYPYPEPIHSPPTNLLTTLSPIYTSVYRVVFYLRASPPKPCTLFSPLLCVPHAYIYLVLKRICTLHNTDCTIFWSPL
jgi:hypothetical protein